jgi:peptide/nickel transport system ATP-binding protein
VVSPILDVREISVEYRSRGEPARAVDQVSFELMPGEFLGVVGESGCGKSTLLFAIVQLLRAPAVITGGEIIFKGTNMVQMSEKVLRAIRWRDYSIVMQSAMNALNPVTTIGAQYADALRAHQKISKEAILDRSRQVFALVGIDPVHLGSFPHQLSGGMRQRAMIAMALLFSPELIVMDEPTSALDVVAQRALMVQIKELQRELGFAVIFVTHDMSLVSHFSDRLAVMYAGQFAELGPTSSVFADPMHPYTVGLLDAFPSVYGPKVYLDGIPGAPPDLVNPPKTCRFQARCPKAMPMCAGPPPEFYELADRRVRCFRHGPAGGIDG